MDVMKETVYVLKDIVRELHEMNRKLGKLCQASIFKPETTLFTQEPKPKDPSNEKPSQDIHSL